MERGPWALFGAIVAIGVGPALWLGAQFGTVEVDPVRPPVVTEEMPDRLVGGAGAGEVTDPSGGRSAQHADVIPLTGSPSAAPPTPAPTTAAPAPIVTTTPPVTVDPGAYPGDYDPTPSPSASTTESTEQPDLPPADDETDDPVLPPAGEDDEFEDEPTLPVDYSGQPALS